MAKQIKSFERTPIDALEVGYLEVVIMSNGEIIHLGKTISTVKKSQNYLFVNAPAEEGAK